MILQTVLCHTILACYDYSGYSVPEKCFKPGLKFEVPRIRIKPEAEFFFRPKACHQFAKHPSNLRCLLLNSVGIPDPVGRKFETF